MASGCLLPPGVNEEEPAGNRPPRILWDTVDPDQSEPVDPLDCDTRRIFEATVEDPDEGDEVWFRFFFDYAYASDAFRLSFAPRKARELNVNAVGALFSVEHGVTAREGSFRTPLIGSHTVELFVADREFADDQLGDARSVGRILVDPEGQAASFTWAVEINEACQ